MRKFGIFSIFVALMLLVSASAIAQEPDSEVVVTLERQACFGACPVYTITIYDDGTVVYNGQRFVEVEGEETINIGAEAVQRLVDVFVEAGYFELEDEYLNMSITDAAYVITSVTADGETKQIVRYDGDFSAPIVLPYLENWIDRVVFSEQWTGVESQRPQFPSARQVVITLERGACFGFCPIYSLAIHDDGTVVYMGFDFVEAEGIRITSIEPEEVAALAELMVDRGYFEWEDEYMQQNVTDHPTTITSLSWDGQYKRIERYGGDRSAPRALGLLEQRIDRAVEELAEWTKTPSEPRSR